MGFPLFKRVYQRQSRLQSSINFRFCYCRSTTYCCPLRAVAGETWKLFNVHVIPALAQSEHEKNGLWQLVYNNLCFGQQAETLLYLVSHYHNTTSTACQLAVIVLDNNQSYAAFLSRYERKLRICKFENGSLWLVRNSTYIFTIKLKALLILFNVPRRTLSQTHSNMISLQFQKDREKKHAREIASKNSIEQYFYNTREKS